MLNTLTKSITNLATFFSNQRHLSSIRDGFITLMPFTIIASFFILINNVLLQPNNGLLQVIGIDASILTEIGIRIYNGTLNFMTILITASVSYKLAKSYNEEGFIYSIFSIACLIIFFPLNIDITISDTTVKINDVISSMNTSATGLFVGILISILSTEFLIKLSKYKKLKISMPDSVPEAVTKSFNSLIPMTIIMILFSIIAFLLNYIFSMDLNTIINKLIQTPLLNILQGLPGILIILFIQNLLWSFGIHGAFILSPITETTLLIAIQENIQAINNNTIPKHIITKPFLDAFGFMGGGGSTIGLIIAILLISKRKEYKSITKLSIIPSIFNINEPLMFGLPIVFNPLLSIPLILTPIINISLAYFATSIGLVNKTTTIVPWTTPPIISGFLATNGDFRAIILSIICIIISTLIYLPFIHLTNKQMKENL